MHRSEGRAAQGGDSARVAGIEHGKRRGRGRRGGGEACALPLQCDQLVLRLSPRADAMQVRSGDRNSTIGASVGVDDQIGRQADTDRFQQRMHPHRDAGASQRVVNHSAHMSPAATGLVPINCSPDSSARSVTCPGAA